MAFVVGDGDNVEKVKEILGEDAELDSWALVFDPETVKKLSACGVALMDDPTEVFVAARAYKGLPTDDFSKSAMEEAADVISAVRPYIRYFHSSQTINDMANGDICVAHGYSGDMLQASDRAAEAENGVTVQYVVPKEGAVVWTDVMVIPADAPNAAAANKFINYLLDPAQAIGMQLKRNVSADNVLSYTQLENNRIVRRGDKVVISSGNSSVSVKMPGEALEDGTQGEQIRVRNTRSNRVIRARVTGPGQVEAGM